MQKYIIEKIFESKRQKNKSLDISINTLLSRDYPSFLENIRDIKDKRDKNILYSIYYLFLLNFQSSEELIRELLQNKEYREYALLLYGFLNNERHAYPQAIAAFEKYLQVHPDDLEVQIYISELLIKIEQKEKAHKRLVKILNTNKQNIKVTSSLIKYFLHFKDMTNALNAFTKIYLLQIPTLEESAELLFVFVKAGAYNMAYELFDILYKRYEKDDELLLKFASFFYEKKKYEKSIELYKKVVDNKNSKIHHFTAYSYLALIYSDMGEIKAVKKYLNILKRLTGTTPQEYHTVAFTCMNISSYDEAIEYCIKSLDVEPTVATYMLLGQCYYQTKQFIKAKEINDKGLELEPHHIGLHWNQSLVYLCEGELEKGFFHYDLRIAPGNNQKSKLPLFNVDLWNGEDLKDKTIFVYDEQGNGDVLAFIRTLPLLVKQAKKVLFVCRDELFPLFVSNKKFFKGVEFLKKEDLPTITYKIDYQVPLMSVCGRVNLTKESIPFTDGYLKASRPMLNKWKKLLTKLSTKKLKVAFTWSGNPDYGYDNFRSIPTELIKPLISQHEDIDFFAVTKGKVDESLENEFKDIPIVRVAPHLDSFDDTAALLELCDLVISVDTAVAHLSLALGKQTWVLLYHFPFWVWGQGDKSIWYDNSKIYKQEKALEWKELLSTVSKDLEDFKKDKIK